MVKYFNKSKVVVPFTDALGVARSVGPKQSVSLSPDADGSASLSVLVKKGVLVKKVLPDPVPEVKVVETKPVEVKPVAKSDKPKKASDSGK